MAKESEGQRVLARAIIEMLGAPKEHIEKTLRDYIGKIKSDKSLEIRKQEIAPAKAEKKLFSAFAELEIWFKSPQKLVDFCFDSMPSSVEIIEPGKIELDSAGLTDTLNDLQARLHNNDMLVKTLKARNSILDKNSKKILRNFVFSLLDNEQKAISLISAKVGIKEQQLKPFLDELVKEGKLEEKEGRYGIKRTQEKD
jgi:hypothetical protein